MFDFVCVSMFPPLFLSVFVFLTFELFLPPILAPAFLALLSPFLSSLLWVLK